MPRTFTFYLWLVTLAWRGGARNLCTKEREEDEKQIQALTHIPVLRGGLLFSLLLCSFTMSEETTPAQQDGGLCLLVSFCICVRVCCPLHHPALTSSPSLFWKWKCQIAKEGMKEPICNRLCWVTVSSETNTPPVLILPRTPAFISVFLYPAK